YNPARWLRLNGSFNFFQFETEGEFNGKDYGAKSTSYFGRLSSKVTLPYGIDWQTNAFYRGATETVQGSRDEILSIDLALSKDLLNEIATLSFNVRDLLNSQKVQSFTSTQFINSDSKLQWRHRSFTVSLIYTFSLPQRD